MSEYSWPVQRAWIGIEVKEPPLFASSKLLGVIRRSGQVRALGHFCFVKVQICGRFHHASGAEDRIYPFHSVRFMPEEKLPELELTYLGWCTDRNTPAFRDQAGRIVKIARAGKDPDNTEAIPENLWQPEWRTSCPPSSSTST
jgi:hypothetical protein